MRDIGLHLRLTSSVVQAARTAAALDLPTFQCFMLHQKTNQFIAPAQKEIMEFQQLRDRFKQLFVHSAYWTNLASIKSISLRFMRRELALAKKLGFTHLIIHPGSAKGAQDKQQGIDALVRRLNLLLKHEHDITLVLENTAHGNMAVGSNLYDFKQILEKVDQPEKLAFCLDTVHAHAYGYAISNRQQQHTFFDIVKETIGFDQIALIHLNNTQSHKGSCIDRHAFFSDGLIELNALKQFVMHRALAHLPIIMELPIAEMAEHKKHVDLVRTWHKD